MATKREGTERHEIIFRPDPSVVLARLREIIFPKCIGLGLILTVIGLLWLLKNLDVISGKVFWPSVLIAIGIACLITTVTEFLFKK